MSLDSPSMAVAGAALVCVIALVALLRRLAVPHLTLWLGLVAAAAWAVAAGVPRWHRPHEGEVAVLVDLSPSTRGADYRERKRLDTRIAQLLGHVKYHLEFFADGVVKEAGNDATLADVPCEKTTLPALTGDAALVFSDGRFALPAAGPPTYVVVDPALEDPDDAAISQLALRGPEISITLRNSGKPRELTVMGTPRTAPTGNSVVKQEIPANASNFTAQLSPGDAWPENDALSVAPPPPASAERWWIGSRPPGNDWRAFSPESLPLDAAAYLAPDVIVLQNVPAASLDQVHLQLLRQYVEELGGGLLILGGDRAFGAGKYVGTDLDAISPLASVPPRPTMRWVLLADASGSMANGTSWHTATDALASALAHLPPDDLADVGSFAQTLSWWSAGKSVRETAKLTLPPPEIFPGGPTNLEPALLQIGRSSDGSMPQHLLLLTDADVQIDQPAKLIALLRQKNIHLHVLAIGAGSGLAELRQIAIATNGSLFQQLDPHEWARSAADLLGAVIPSSIEHRPISIQFENELAKLPPRDVNEWNRTWLKDSARELAFANYAGQHLPLAARWLVGQGSVCAVGAAPNPGEIDALAALTGRAPRDPRFAVAWETGESLRAAVDAKSGPQYLNDQVITLQLSNQTPQVLPQIGPGQYELEQPPPRSSVFATLRVAGHVVDRIAVAGRYAPEFDAIGNDHAAMEEIARRTGGAVIFPDRQHPIAFDWPGRDVPLTSWFAIGGAMLAACGLAVWRLQ